MSKLKSLAGETIVYGIGSVLPKIINFVFIAVYLTRVIETDTFGIYTIMYAYSSILIAVYTFRMETTFFRFGKSKVDRGKVFFNVSLLVFSITAAGSLLMGVFSKSIAAFLTGPEDQRYVLWFLFIIAFDALSAVPFAKLRLENKSKKFAFLKILNVLIIAGIVAFFLGLLPSLSESGVSWANNIYQPNRELDFVFLANLVASGVVLILLLSEYKDMLIKYDGGLMKKMIRYASPLFVVVMGGVISSQLDRFLIKEWSSDIKEVAFNYAGLYGGVIKIAVLMSIFTMAFNYAAEPFFFKNSEEGKTTKLYGSIALAYTMVASVLFLIISMYIDQFQYLIGVDFRSGVEVVPLLALGFLIFGIFYNFSIWYKLSDNTKYGAGIALAGAIISLMANYLLIPEYNIYGAAVAALISYLSMCIITYYYGQRLYPIHYPIIKIVGYVLLAVIVYAVFYFMKGHLGEYIKVTFASLLLVGYIVTCYLLERKNFKAILAI